MTRSFVDTNVLVYAYDSDEPTKQERAVELLERLGDEGRLVISTQVLQEFYVTVTRKLARPLPTEAALEALEAWAELPMVAIDPPLVLEAARTSRDAKLSLWDALVVCAAAAGGCDRVLTEDLQDGFELCGVRVENPFRGL